MFASGFELASHSRIVLAHMRYTTGGRHNDDFGVAELLDEARQQRESLIPVACVDVHLAAAGLAGREVDGMAQALKDANNGLACGGKQGVVVAGDEQRDAQGGSFAGTKFQYRFYFTMIVWVR